MKKPKFEKKEVLGSKWTHEFTQRARRELKKVVQILAQWGVPEEVREERAKEIYHLLREEGYTGEPSPTVVLAALEGEL